MRDVKRAALKGDADAVLARAVYVERVRKYLGSYVVKLHGNVDAVVFTAGVGEHDSELREAICANLESLGIAIDPVLNKDGARFGEGQEETTDAKDTRTVLDVSAKFSRTKVLVVKTDEEEAIALQAAAVADLFQEEARLAAEARAAAARATIASTTSRQRQEVTSTAAVAPFHSRGLYVDGVGPTAAEEVGLLYQLLPYGLKLGYFRPFANENDRKLKTIRDLFQLEAHPLEAMRGATVSHARSMLAAGREEELLDEVVAKFVEYSADKDFVLVSRGHLGQLGDAFWTAKVAAALSVPVVYVVHDDDVPGFAGGGGGRRRRSELPKHFSSTTATTTTTRPRFGERVSEVASRVKEALDNRGGRLAGLIATLPRDEDAKAVAEVLEKNIGVYPAALLPPDERLSNISLEEICVSLGAKVLRGTPDELAFSYAKGVVVATRFANETVLHQLLHMPPGQLVVAHAARTDLLLAIAMAQQSPDFPRVAGVVFSGADGGHSLPELEQEQNIPADLAKTLALLQRVPASIRVPPVLAVNKLTYDVASEIHNMLPVLLPSSRDKIEAAQVLFETHLDPAFRRALVDAATAESSSSESSEDVESPTSKLDVAVATPKLFQHRLFSKARADRQTIVLPEGEDRRVVAAAAELVERNLVNVVILGDPDVVRAVAAEARVEDTIFQDEDATTTFRKRKMQVLDPRGGDDDSEMRRAMIRELVEARAHKGMTADEAAALLKDDPNYFGTMLLQLGLADGMVSGACHSTAATMRPPLQIVKMKPGFHIVSSVFFMLLADGVKLFGDCAINISPSADELAQIAAASAVTARSFGIEPRVAMLSYATGDSNTGELIDKVRDATTKAREMLPNDLFEGPIQFDAAVDPAVAEVKYHGQANQVAGVANTLIFPSLDAGNSAYKAVQQASHCVAIGPIMQGLRLPVNDLSRGCTVNDIVNTVVVTAIQAQAGKAAGEN